MSQGKRPVSEQMGCGKVWKRKNSGVYIGYDFSGHSSEAAPPSSVKAKLLASITEKSLLLPSGAA